MALSVLILGFYVVWCRFRMLRWHMAKNSSVHELARIKSLLLVVSAGAPRHGPVHLLLSSAFFLGFLGILTYVFRLGLVCLLFARSLVLFSFFREAVWDAWRTKVAGDLSSRARFHGGRCVPMGAAMLSAAMLAAFMFLHTGFRSMTTGLEKDLKGSEPAAFDAIASLAATLPLVFDYAATAGPAALVPWVFAIAFAALSVICALRKRTSLSGRIQVVPLEDDQALDDPEADHHVWNDSPSCLCTMRLLRSWCLPWMIPLSALWP